MGYQELIDALHRQVAEERANLLAEADRRCRLILDEAQREVERLRKELAADDFHDANLQREKILAEAEQEILLKQLEMKRRTVDRVRGMIDAELEAQRKHPEYKNTLEALVDEVLSVLPEPKQWMVDRRDLPLLKEILSVKGGGKKAEIDSEQRFLGGVIALSPDGKLKAHNTLEARLAKEWQALEVEIGRTLVPEEK